MTDFEGENGDRRQEIIFIGQFDQSGNSVDKLEHMLDSCLLTDPEMNEYQTIVKRGGGDIALNERFVNQFDDDDNDDADDFPRERK